jgi:hypothetical protein
VLRRALVLALLLAACASLTPEERLDAVRREADAVSRALEAAAVRAHALPAKALRESAMEEVQEARDALGVAVSAAAAGARTKDGTMLAEGEEAVADLHRWAEAFLRK